MILNKIPRYPRTQRLLILVSTLLLVGLAGCEEDAGITPSPPPPPKAKATWITIKTPAPPEYTHPSEIDEIQIGGSAFVRKENLNCDTGICIDNVTVTWTNQTTNISGNADINYLGCASECNRTWLAIIPTVVGENTIVLRAGDYLGSATDTITIHIADEVPSAVNDTFVTYDTQPIKVYVLANDQTIMVDPLSVASFTQGAHGSVKLNTDNTLTYTPKIGVSGADSFSYTIQDDEGNQATAQVSGTLTLNSVPIATNDSVTTDEDYLVEFDVLANDSDADGDLLKTLLFTYPASGSLKLLSNGVFQYQPDLEFSGEDSFTYTIGDGKNGWAVGTVTLIVKINNPPIAAEDAVWTDEETPITIDILANDSDPDGDTFILTGISGAANGTVSINADKTIHYTPDLNFDGSDSFTYTLLDSRGDEAMGTATITINPINDAVVLITPIPNQGLRYINPVHTLDLSTFFMDVDQGDILSFAITANSDSTTVKTNIAGSILTLALGSGTSHSASITVQATDNGVPVTSLSDTFTVFPSHALYQNGIGWNDYVKNDGGDRFAATDTACNGTETGGYNACLHGGETLVFDTGLTTACADLTATDVLGAFNWVCGDSGVTTRIYSQGLKAGKYLSDLIDFTSGAWLDNQLVVNDGFTDVYLSREAPWWNNPVVIDNDGLAVGEAVSGTIYLVTVNPNGTYLLDASKVGLVIQPGVTFIGSAEYTGTLIRAVDQSFLWLEGTLDAAKLSGGVIWNGVNFSIMRDLNSNNTTFHGVYLANSSNNLLSDISAANNHSSGILLRDYTNSNTFSGVSAMNNGGSGVSLYNSSSNTFSDVSADNNGGRGVSLSISSSNTFSGVSADNHSNYGIYLGSNSDNNVFSDVSADNNGINGIYLENYSSYNTFSGVSADNNGSHGIALGWSSKNTFFGVSAINNGYYGIQLTASSFNTFSGISAVINGDSGIQLRSYSRFNTFANISADNNGNHGIYLPSSENSTFSGVSATNNGSDGILLFGYRNTFSGVNAANNGSAGVSLYGYQNVFSGVSATNNGSDGIYLYSPYNTFADVSTTNNGIYGINLSSNSHNTFTGLLKVGGNTTLDCYVLEGATPGLEHGTCANQGSSDATLITGVTAATSYVGKVTMDDTSNASDTAGAATYPTDPTAFDWLNFDNPNRGWGPDGNDFPNADNRGLFGCSVYGYYDQTGCVDTGGGIWTGLGRIWDWSLALGDTGDPGADEMAGTADDGPVLLNVLYLPTAEDTFTQTWSTGSTSTFLRNAVEILGDGVGNENLLCESGEHCLYTPNIGAYQGHGALIEAGTIGTGGAIENVILWKYEINGY